MATASMIDKSLQRFAGAQLKALAVTVDELRRLLPTATEGMSYGMPTLFIDGVGVFAVDGFKNHNSLFPMSGAVPVLLAAELPGCTISKGTIQFPLDRALPKALLRKIVAVKIAEVNAGYPKKSGEFKEFYGNGALKATGRMKDGVMTGAWKWYRRDGSLMRSGSFTAGQQSGEWVTYAADGRVVKRTQFSKATSAKKAPAKKAPAKKAPTTKAARA